VPLGEHRLVAGPHAHPWESEVTAGRPADRGLHRVIGGTHYFIGQADLQAEVFDRIDEWLRR
jgi:hypothetical protein